ncbi:cell division protein ZapA [Aquirufa nivalisilvae]|uniref:Uncharacterized protein n=1 Tax=Aquirufa nivalisilvae TaxID=2516557 RepID=A0A2S2DSV4_9BACT|nr:cell division protein ZapA [Aquirufa nivalisilvae]AWL08382.1 hypothetical protein HME7025_00510 [Aquirufa nivalisilvae]MCZ2478854.1 cell division protein ZapA [Aquirufa nivalisilvae]TBH75785.1 cell division protein ZapA [Aquirufa nivalisilvae]
MSQNLPCNLILGIQTIAMKVDPQEEAYVRNAANLVNRLVKYYEQQTNSSDPSAVMALVALDLAMCGIKFDEQHRSLESNILNENKQLLELTEIYAI